MSKTLSRKLFVASLVAIAGGLVLLAGAGVLAYANGSFVMHGPDVVGVHATPFGWVMIGLAGVAVLVLCRRDHPVRRLGRCGAPHR